jgi:hypothetical protein
VKLHTRLQRLERRVVDPGCPGCRERRGFNVLVNAHRLPDGTLAYPNDDEPKPCPQCGEVPESVIAVIRTVVETREDVARLKAERWQGVT